MRTSADGLAFRRAGSGPAVVLVHGIPGSAVSWRRTAELLPDTLDVIVPDLLGFGASARPVGFEALRAEAQATALERLLEELGIERATVVGHDFGGPVALALTARRQAVVASLGLLATNAFTDTPIPFPLSTVSWPVVGNLLSPLLFSRMSLAMMLRRGAGRPGAAPDPSTYLGDAAQRRAIATIFHASLTGIADVYRPIQAQLHAIGVPVFVGWGGRDPFFSVAQGERTAGAAGTVLRLYPDAGHFLPEECPEEVARDVVALVAAAVA